MSHSLAPFVHYFFSHYLPHERGLSSNTSTTYRDAIKLLLCYISDTLPKPVDELLVEDISEELVLGFLEYLEQVRNCCSSTRNLRLAAIRSLFTLIARREPVLIAQCQQIRAIPQKRSQHKVIDYVEEKEMRGILTAIDVNSRTGVRDNALMLVLYNTGARVSEIVNLKLEDMQLGDNPQVKLIGKGRKERESPLWPETAQALKQYLQIRRPVNNESNEVFLNINGLPITRFGIRYITRKLGNQGLGCRSQKLNPHVLRHTAAMHLLHAGNEITMISYWLGHASINTTHVYVEIDIEMKRKMIEKAEVEELNKQPVWQQPNIINWLEALNRRSVLCEVNC